MVSGSDALLQAEGLAKTYDGEPALDGLDLAVAAGEIFCLLGANGAGKSTTIGLFLGLIKPTAGRALVAGVDPARDRLAASRHLAYIPEQVALYPQLSGLENLDHFVRLSGRRLTPSALLEHLSDAGLPQDAARRKTRTYSKGMRQKVGIAIAAARDADALLLDEPMSGLDPSAANAFARQLIALKEAGKTALMATHDIFRAKMIGDRVGIMRAGRLVDVIATADVDAARLEEIYLSHMAEEA